MVHIINGEIVPDDDPRVKARLQGAGAGPSQRRPGGGFGGVAGLSSGGAASPPQQQGLPQGQQASPLQGLARTLGLEGSITIPAFLGFPAKPVEKVHLAIAALLIFLFGWRALVIIAFAFFVSLDRPAAAAPAAPPQPPGGPGGPAGVRRL